MTWKTVSVVDNSNMMVPHVLQQKYVPEQSPSKLPRERELVPSDEHRLIPISDLNGVE
jgi:hypothetical protein